MADGNIASQTAKPSVNVSDAFGTIYVIDLIGFSRMTEARMATNARRGTETITRLVTDLFSQLMESLSVHNIQFGGIAGDALIAWQTHRASSISNARLQTLATQVCNNVWPGLGCRTAKAEGRFWLQEADATGQSRAVLWGPAVSHAFDALSQTPRRSVEDSLSSSLQSLRASETLTTATVTDRRSIVIKALTPSECQTATPEMVHQVTDRISEICAAYSATVDNIVQDDKGLLVIIVLPPAPEYGRSTRDALLRSLTSGRDPVTSMRELSSKYGTVFRYSPVISGQAVTITIGQSINQAARTLSTRSNTVLQEEVQPKPSTTSAAHKMIGREVETATLIQSLHSSADHTHTTGLIGPAGIGKTTIIQCLQQQTIGSHALIEVSPGSRYLPFGAAQDLAEACGLSAGAVFDQSGQAELANALPSNIIIENWQWCDRDSKRLIRRLHEDRRSGLLLVSSRQHIDGLTIDTDIAVAPFDRRQSEQLLDTLAPNRLSAMTKQSIHDVTRGTPFWLAQAGLHYAARSDALTPVDNLSGLEALLSARAEHLTSPAIALWRVFCAWRRPLSFDLAISLLERFDIAASTEHLDELNQLGWIATEPALNSEQLRPAHDILAD